MWKKKGLSAGPFRDQLADGYLEQIRASGIDVVEGSLGEDGSDGDDCALLERVRDAVEAVGLSVWSVHTPFGDFFDISSPDVEIRERGMKGIAAATRGCKALGGSLIVVHPSHDLRGSGETTTDRFPRAQKNLKIIIEYAADLGIRVAVENLPPAFLGHKAADLLRLIEPYSPDVAGICIDSGHANIAPKPEPDFAMTVAPRVITTHLHDNTGDGDHHTVPGKGSVDWESVCAALGKTFYAGPMLFETKLKPDFSGILKEIKTASLELESILVC